MDTWLERFEKAGPAARFGLLAGGAIRLAASAAETAIDRAASITVEAREAFRKEMDPNISDATILEETTDTPRGKQNARLGVSEARITNFRTGLRSGGQALRGVEAEDARAHDAAHHVGAVGGGRELGVQQTRVRPSRPRRRGPAATCRPSRAVASARPAG